MNHRRNKTGLVRLLVTVMLSTLVSASYAQEKHPHYLHALSDLRHARGWLTALGENNVMGREMDAVAKIDKAIGELKRASIDDGKDLKDHPPVDAHAKHKGRLHKSLALLESALRDIKFEEDDMKALGWRKAAIHHVEDAIKANKQAINDVKNDS